MLGPPEIVCTPTTGANWNTPHCDLATQINIWKVPRAAISGILTVRSPRHLLMLLSCTTQVPLKSQLSSGGEAHTLGPQAHDAPWQQCGGKTSRDCPGMGGDLQQVTDTWHKGTQLLSWGRN